MKWLLHITSGDIAGETLRNSGVPGEVFVWHDILYDGPRKPGWPDDVTLHARALFLEEETGGGLSRQLILETLRDQYLKLETVEDYDGLVLWFDACLFDQSMLSHILACMAKIPIIPPWQRTDRHYQKRLCGLPKFCAKSQKFNGIASLTVPSPTFSTGISTRIVEADARLSDNRASA